MKFYGIFIPVPVPENWIGISHSRSRYQEWNINVGNRLNEARREYFMIDNIGTD